MQDQILDFVNNHSLLALSFVAALGAIIFYEFRNFTRKYDNLTPAAAIQLINKDNTVLLDVREPNEVMTGSIDKSMHIPMSAMSKRIGELDKHKDKSILVYCRSGNRSGSVCRQLNGKGFEQVYNLAGGVLAWQDAHLPLRKKR